MIADDTCQFHWHGVAELAHGFRPCPLKLELVGEGLQAGAFAHGEIPYRTVQAGKHVFPAGYTVNTRFQGLGGLVERAAGMAGVRASAGLVAVVEV